MNGGSASSHVVAVISKNVNGAVAEAILYMLTHDASNVRIGNNVTIAADNVYLLHLPKDVVSSIPTIIQNSGLGEGPNYLDPLNVIADIANMAFNFLVYVLTTATLYLQQLLDIGLQELGSLANASAAAMTAAVNVIVNAFTALVAFAVEWLMAAFQAFFDPLVGLLKGLFVTFCQSVHYAIEQAEQDVVEFGSVSVATTDYLLKSFNNDLINVLIAIAVMSRLLIDAAMVLSGGVLVLVAILGSVVLTYLLFELFDIAGELGLIDILTDTFDGIYAWMADVFGPGDDPPEGEQIAWTAFGTCIGVLGVVLALPGFLNFQLSFGISFALSILSMAVGIYATAINSYGMGLLGIAMGAGSAIISYKDSKNIGDPGLKQVSRISIACGLVGAFCSGEAL